MALQGYEATLRDIENTLETKEAELLEKERLIEASQKTLAEEQRLLAAREASLRAREAGLFQANPTPPPSGLNDAVFCSRCKCIRCIPLGLLHTRKCLLCHVMTFSISGPKHV